MSVEVRVAETEAERRRLYAFRYRIYVEEMGRTQKHADHRTRLISDPMDRTAHNLVAWRDDEIIGCVRINFARDGGLDYYRELLRMDGAGAAWPHAVSLCTRLMIRPDWRNSPLAIRLSVAAFELGLWGGIRFNFIDCNDHLADFFARIGYVLTHRPVHEEYGQVNAMRFDLGDEVWLASPGSPFRRSFARWQLETRGRAAAGG